jgi:ethanolamine utilization protein EutA
VGRKAAGSKPHSLADHVHGEDHDHDHDHDADHEHDSPVEGNAIWLQDNLQLSSVGIDIGSAGTQVIFSRLHLRRMGEDLSSRYFVVNRETLYQSPVALTPYASETRIDEAALGRIMDEAYAGAGLHPDSIDTGSVILTGEALRRENAQAIGELLAEMGGEFVCATAGHHMEAMLAAYGSGAARVSHDRGWRVLNIDIGGGTTKLALIEHGRVLETAAIHVGGRLLVADAEGRITRLDPQGQALARGAGFDWALGKKISAEDLDQLAAWMAEALCRAILGERALYLTDPLKDLRGVQGVMFSGGVGEYVYGRESRDFGDLGRRLGLALKHRLDRIPGKLLPAGECIRATAFGASEYSVQLSGNTVYVSEPGALLPRRNLQVLQPPVHLEGALDAAQLARTITEHFKAFDLVEGEGEVALAFKWRGEPAFERLSSLARAITLSLPNTIRDGKPIYLVLEGDVAQTLGAILKEDWGLRSEVLVIDGVALRDFDYIDLGRIRVPSNTVPVTIKSLVFGQDPRVPHRHGHEHDGEHHRH